MSADKDLMHQVKKQAGGSRPHLERSVLLSNLTACELIFSCALLLRAEGSFNTQQRLSKILDIFSHGVFLYRKSENQKICSVLESIAPSD